MKNQVLSIEQMQHLKELGVDISKASCAYYAFYESEPNYYELRIRDNVLEIDPQTIPFIPTFTLQDMLEMMPRELYLLEEKFILEIYPFLDSWYVRYMPDEKSGFVPYSFHSYKIINAVYECLCWWAKNNYIGGNNESK